MSLLEQFTKTTKNSLEKTMLECSIFFTFNKDKKIDELKGNLFVETVFTLLINQKQPCSTEQISDIFKSSSGRIIELEEFESALKKLQKIGYVTLSEHGWVPNSKKVDGVREEVEKTENAFSQIVEEILNILVAKSNNNLTDDNKEQSRINIQESLSLYARLHGIDYLLNEKCDTNNDSEDEETDLIKCAKRGLDDDTGNLLVEIIAGVLSKPTDFQAETIDLLIKSFVFAQIMQVDPLLNQFALNQLKKKTFFLDTDFVLNSITQNHSLSKPYRRLISTLKNIGCDIIIPREVLEEVVRHARSAERNNGWFNNAFESLDQEIIEKEATNVFVKDYHLWKINNSKEKSLRSFMKRYYDDILPYEFMEKLIEDELDIVVEKEKLNIKQEQQLDLDTLTEKIKTAIDGAPKSQYRDDNETLNLAKTDALLYLNTMALNLDGEHKNNDILSHNAYLITYTTKSIRCAKEMKIHKDIVTRPEILINILSRIGSFESKKKTQINLFDNPFLTYIMRKNWDIVKKVSDFGIDLHDTTITRLRYDLEDTLNAFMTDKADSETINRYYIIEGTDSDSVNEFMKLIDTIEKKNYKINPELQAIVEKYKEKDECLEKEIVARKKMEETLNNKAKRYEHYQRMMGKRNSKATERKGIDKRKFKR